MAVPDKINQNEKSSATRVPALPATRRQTKKKTSSAANENVRLGFASNDGQTTPNRGSNREFSPHPSGRDPPGAPPIGRPWHRLTSSGVRGAVSRRVDENAGR